MNSFLAKMANALPAAAAHPLALAAYVVLVSAWCVVALRVSRNRNLLNSLEKLPEHDRLRALEHEMGVIPLKGKVSPEQWLRSRIHTFYFYGFAILCLTVIVVFAIASFQQGAVTAFVTPLE